MLKFDRVVVGSKTWDLVFSKLLDHMEGGCEVEYVEYEDRKSRILYCRGAVGVRETKKD